MAKNTGTVIQIMGPVLDIRFPEGNLPELLTAIEVAAGGTVSFYATFADPRLAVPGFAVRGFITVTYEVEGISHQHSYEHIYTHSPESYEVYAEHFDGIDFTDYYELYLPYV